MENTVQSKKMMAALTAIFLGHFGVHKFVLGYKKEGIILLSVTLGLFFLGFCVFLTWIFLPIVFTFSLIEGIIYLTKSDEDFVNTYQINKKPWF
jgi:TM2 domain-containing membrane protein YozV